MPALDPSLVWIGPQLPSDNRSARRERKRELARAVRTIEEADIPPGSLLSEATLAAIRAGHYAIAKPPNAPGRPGSKLAREVRRRQVFGAW